MPVRRVSHALALTFSASLAATLLPTALVGGPASAVEPADWECYAYADGVNASGTPVRWRYELGTVSEVVMGPGTLGFVPRDVAYTHEGGSGGGGGGTGTSTSTGYWFALAGSELREVAQTSTYRNDDGSHVSSSYTSRVMGSGWSGVRQISFGEGASLMYGLNGSGLVRYRVSGTPGQRTVATDQVIATSGWAGVKSLSYVGSWAVNGVRSDVFVSVISTTGELVEYVFPQANPKAYQRRVLKSSTWNSMDVVTTDSYCYDFGASSQYEGLLGVQPDGDIYRYFDTNPRDLSGADIGGLGRTQVAWAPKAYND